MQHAKGESFEPLVFDSHYCHQSLHPILRAHTSTQPARPCKWALNPILYPSESRSTQWTKPPWLVCVSVLSKADKLHLLSLRHTRRNTPPESKHASKFRDQYFLSLCTALMGVSGQRKNVDRLLAAGLLWFLLHSSGIASAMILFFFLYAKSHHC